ncbi:LuxR C-terminal-related transcriptional regulator [Achromobacter aegrifaciens]
MLYAASLYESNNLGLAERLMHVYVPLAKDAGLADHMIIGYDILARIAFHRGDIDQAFYVLTELEYMGHQRRLPRVVASARLARAMVLLMQDNLQAAGEGLSRADDAQVWERVQRLRLPAHDLEYLALARLRWEVAGGDARTALARLETEIDAAVAASRHRRALKLRLLRSLALKQLGNQAAALAAMDEVLKIACGEGFVRMIVDEGAGAGFLVRLLARARQESSERNDPIFSEYLQRLLKAFGESLATETESPAAGHAPELGEPLTGKEIGLLLLLAEGYSNSALAEKLFISDSTVRTHLRNINAKLNARNRTQAVAVGRRLGLIA